MDIIKYLKEAVILEINVSKLYFIFANKYQEDWDFWWQLSNEELNHAAILKSASDFINLEEFPTDLIPYDIEEMIELNNMFDDIIKDFEKNPSRQKCFEIALEIESSAGESHYQEVMEKYSDNELVKVFQKLNRDDIDHYERIKKYYGDNII